MPTFHRASLPKSIKYNGKEYVKNALYSSLYSEGKLFAVTQHIKVHVLSRRLKNKLNFHGKPYQPTKWIFTPIQ